jgi:DNA-binding transcriptional ArsR family regulator
MGYERRRMSEERDVGKAIEAGLGSPVRVRILRLLATEEGLTKYAITKGARLKSREAAKGLRALVDLGWVEKASGRPAKYRLNADNEVVRHLLVFLLAVQDSWEYNVTEKPPG